MNLSGALVDDRTFGVPHEPLHVVFVGVAVGAVNLHSIHGGLERRFRGKELCHGGFPGVPDAHVLHPPNPVVEQPGDVQVHGHLGDHLLHELELPDFLSKRHAGVGIRHRCFQGCPDAPGRACGDGVPGVVQRRHGDLEAFAFLAEAVFHRNWRVVEGNPAGVAGVHAQLAVDGAGGYAGEAPLDDERRDAPMPFLRVGLGEDQEVVGHVRQGDPHLLAVEDVDVPLTAGPGAHPGHVGARARLGEAVARDFFAFGLGDEVLLLLFLGAPLQERQAVQRHVHGDGLPDGRVGPLQFLGDDAQGDVVHSGTAVADRNTNAQDAEFGHLGQ